MHLQSIVSKYQIKISYAEIERFNVKIPVNFMNSVRATILIGISLVPFQNMSRLGCVKEAEAFNGSNLQEWNYTPNCYALSYRKNSIQGCRIVSN